MPKQPFDELQYHFEISELGFTFKKLNFTKKYEVLKGEK